jgi:cytochrome c553
MRTRVIVLGMGLVAAAGLALAAQAKDPPPLWAFAVYSGKPVPPPKPGGPLMTLPGSKLKLTLAQVNDRFHVPDWRPRDHPAMPAIVSSGKPPNVFACGYCHLPNGHGRPENAPVAGQPSGYIFEQVMEMKAGRRKTSVPKVGSIAAMMKIAAAVSPADLKIAADYFAGLRYTPWIRVVEADTVPRTVISSHNMMVPAPGGGKEKLGNRIIEMPEDVERVELRDPASGFVAYVPVGSIAAGKTLVETGGGAFPCASCHGPDLKGAGNVPGLAGRSPSYLARQLYDFQHGSRGGPAADPMKPEVANLNAERRLQIAAYLASLKP